MLLFELLPGALYLILSLFFGYLVARQIRRQLKEIVILHQAEQLLPRWMLEFAVAILVGIILPPTLTYILALLCRPLLSAPLWWANVITTLVIVLFCGCRLYARFLLPKLSTPCPHLNTNVGEGPVITRSSKIHAVVFAQFWLLISSFLTAGHLAENSGTVSMGSSMFYDMLFHIAQVQSFALGENIPAQNVYFAGAANRYHFMLDFLSGNLAYLGWSVSLSINIPGVLAIFVLGLMLYCAGVCISRSVYGGWLAILLFIFRSSAALLYKIPELRDMKWEVLLDYLQSDLSWIGTTKCENWALWTLNAFTNQHHFGVGLAIFLLVFLWHTPHIFSAAARVKQPRRGLKAWWRSEFDQTFSLQRLAAVIIVAVLAGLSAMFNGATFLAALLVLGAVLFLGDRRLDTLVFMLVALGCALLERQFIAGGAGGESSFIHIGFLAKSGQPADIAEYYLRTFGILFPLVVIYFVLLSAYWRRLALVAVAPLIFASCYVVAGEVARNHKLVTASVILSNILLALPLVRLWRGPNFSRILATVLLVLLTNTGFYDLRTLILRSMNLGHVTLVRPATEWIKKETSPQSVFVSAPSVQHLDDLGPIPVLVGRKVYIGYREFLRFTDLPHRRRDAIVRSIYEGSLGDKLPEVLRQEKIDYVVLDSQAETAGVFKSAKNAFDTYLTAVMHDDEATIYQPRTTH